MFCFEIMLYRLCVGFGGFIKGFALYVSLGVAVMCNRGESNGFGTVGEIRRAFKVTQPWVGILRPSAAFLGNCPLSNCASRQNSTL